MLSKAINNLEIFVFQFWWVVLFLIFCYMSYEQGLKTRNQDYQMLHAHLMELQRDKEQALALQEDLKLQLNSQSDPDWVELTLMRKLGVVAEGQSKVFFSDQE